MCFLGEPFKHDLFVSYSHGAFAGTHNSDLKLWSQKFAKDLRAELAGSGEFNGISMFLDEGERSDENVDRTEQLTGQLHASVTGSALFTLLLTPHYLRSKWCRQELDWWCGKHHPDTLGAGSRAYVCRVRPSDQATWPEPIKDVVGYFCYDRDENEDKARPFTWKSRERDRDDYVDLLVDLSGEMAQRLRAIKAILDDRRRQEEQARKYAAGSGQVLFLHGRPQAATAWDQAYDRLQEAGFFMVPDKPVLLRPMAVSTPNIRPSSQKATVCSSSGPRTVRRSTPTSSSSEGTFAIWRQGAGLFCLVRCLTLRVNRCGPPGASETPEIYSWAGSTRPSPTARFGFGLGYEVSAQMEPVA